MKRLKEIGKLRDGIFLSVACVYAIGYVVWSLNAWLFNLGYLPTIDARYIAAGLPCALIIWLTYLVFRRPLPEFLKVSDENKKEALYWKAFLWGVLIWIALLPAILLLYDTNWLTKYPRFESVVFLVSLVLWLVGLVCLAIAWTVWRQSSKFPRQLFSALPDPWPDRIVRIVIGYIFGTVFLLSYVALLFPSVPQELGGFRPRLAVLHIVTEGVSPALLRDIIDPNECANEKVTRSKPMYVFHYSDQRVLVKHQSEYSRWYLLHCFQRLYMFRSPKKNPTFEISAASIKSIEWRD